MASRPTTGPHRATLGLLVGLTGSILLALGGFAVVRLTDGYSFPGLGVLHRTSSNYGLGEGLILCGVGLLVVAWVMLAEVHLTTRRAVLTAVVWAVPMLVAPPLLSTDMYLYADQGWQQLHGLNPYHTELGTVGPYAPLVSDAWVGTTAAYPPLALRLQALAVLPAEALAGLLGVPAVPFVLPVMRLIGVISVVGLGWGATVLARRFGRSGGLTLWWVVLNPVTMVHLIGDGHNDAPAAALVMLGLAVASRRLGWLWGGLLVGAAACVKQPVLAAVVPVGLLAARTWAATATNRVRVVRTVVTVAGSTVVGVAGFVVVHLLCGLGAGWMAAIDVPGEVGTFAPASVVTAVVTSVAEGLEVSLPGTTGAVVLWAVRGVLLLGLLLVAWRWRRNPVLVGGAGLTTVALALAALRTWYLSWGLGLFVFGARPRTLGGVGGTVSGLVVIDAIHKHAAMGRLGELLVGVVAGLAVAMVMSRALSARMEPERADPAATEVHHWGRGTPVGSRPWGETPSTSGGLVAIRQAERD